MTAHSTNEDEEIDIDDPRLPDALREHGQRFKKPARWVIDLGNGEYLLFSEESELLDAVYNCF